MNARAVSLYSGLALSLLGAVALSQDTPGDEFYGFNAQLSGAQEPTPPEAPGTPSPGVTTQAAGDIEVLVARDLSLLEFRLSVTNGVGVTQAHLHCARAGENGPVVVALMDPNAQGADVNGVLGEGTRTNMNIEASAAGCEQAIGRPVRNIASLAAAAAAGLIYANVHTVANPAGEIRGQLVPGELSALAGSSRAITTSGVGN